MSRHPLIFLFFSGAALHQTLKHLLRDPFSDCNEHPCIGRQHVACERRVRALTTESMQCKMQASAVVKMNNPYLRHIIPVDIAMAVAPHTMIATVMPITTPVLGIVLQRSPFVDVIGSAHKGLRDSVPVGARPLRTYVAGADMTTSGALC